MKSDMNTNVLKGRRMNLADYVFQRFGAEVPAGTTLTDIMQPAYFRNYAHQLKPKGIIEVLSDDMTLDATLRVITVTNKTVTCRVMRDSSTKDQAVTPPSAKIGSTVEWGGPSHKWRIMNAGQVIDKGFGTREDAESAMKEAV